MDTPSNSEPEAAEQAHHPAFPVQDVGVRARLALPVLPAPLRATAEAALEAEVVDALAQEDLAWAAALVAAWAPEVEGAAVSRVLRLVDAHAAAAGRYADAAVLVEGVAAEEAGTPAHGELLALAAVFAERGGEVASPGGGDTRNLG